MTGKKFFSKLLKLIVSVFVLFIFAGCENFLSGGMLQTELETIIADSKAQTVTIDFSGADGFGEIFVNGTSGRQFQIKEGKNFSLEFKVKEDYEFVGWSVETEGIKEARTGSSETDLPEGEVPADETPDAENPIDKYIKIEETEELSTTVKIIKYVDGIKIIPVCKVRPKIVTSGPENSINGVSRDRAVSATFTDIIPAENFSFADDEIPAEATPVYDEEGNIWAYETSQEGRILKNIEIKNSDGESVASHYKKPVFDTETKTLSIEADKDNPLQIEVGETKMVYVTLKKEIKGENGASLYQDKSWYFKATADTDEKAIITIKANSEEGRALNENSQLSYSILQKINLSFTENADWQFVRWNYDANIVNVIEPGNPNTIAQVINQTKDAGGQEHPSDIKAVCAKRPVVDAQNTLPKTQTGTAVSRDSSIHIVFDHNLPTDEAGKKQLENIAITVGGNTVKSSFKAPVINGKTVTFAADKNNLIGVNEGQTKTVTVTVPADFYYELDDDAKTKVVMGGNGFTYDYKIDSSTIDKAEIFVTAVEGSGTLTYTKSEENKYSIGQTIQLKFEPNAGYQFNGWKVKCGEDDVSEVDLKIADKTKTETTLTVYSALGGVTVNPDCSSLLSVIYTAPETSVEKDSEIVFSFNNKPEINNEDLSKITITIDGMNAAGMYSERSIEGKTVTIKNTQRPIVNKGDEKTVYVTVPKEYYYLNGTTKVYIENDYTFSFKINHKTHKKAEVSFAVVNGESEQYAKLADAGTLEGCEETETETLNLDEVKNLILMLNEGYYFYGFKYLKSDGSDITSDVLTVTGSDAASKEIVFNKEIKAARIYAVCYKLPTVLRSSPSSENEADTFPKNSPIEINLNHRVEDECKNKIRVSYTGGTITASEYFDVTIQNGTQIRLNPKMGAFLKLREGQSYETVTVTVPADIFYTDAVTGKKITMGTDDYVWSYKINNDTVSKTKVTFQNNSNDPNATLKANGQVQSSATFYECSQDQLFTLNYNLSSGYGFTGWNIEAPVPYTVEGGKVVYEGKTYFEIADVNSPDTTASSLIVIGNGIKISAGQYSIPKVDHLSVEYKNSGIEFDNPVVIYFNNQLNNDEILLTDSSVSPILTRSVSIVENGKEYNHLENYFALDKVGNTLKLTPKGDLSSFVKDENSTFDIKISLNENSNYLIKDSNNNPLEGNTEFVYRINGKTKAKTPISYVASNGNLYINEKKNTVNAPVEYSFNNSSLVNINYEVNENYKFNKWNISVPEQYETVEEDGLFTVKKDEEVLFTVEDIYNSKTSFSVIRCIPEGITIEAENTILPTATFTPSYTNEGEYYTTTIEILFNKEINPASVTLTTLTEEGDVETEGSVNITSASITSQHYENYFTYRVSDDMKSLYLIPNEEITLLVPKETSKFDFTITLGNSGNATVKDNNNNTIYGKNSWNYRINGKAPSKTPVQFEFEKGTISVDGSVITSNYIQEFSYNRDNEISLSYGLDEGYEFKGWSVTLPEGYSKEETGGNLVVTKDSIEYFVIRNYQDVKATLIFYKAIADGITINADEVLILTWSAETSYLETGISCDTVIKVNFNKRLLRDYFVYSFFIVSMGSSPNKSDLNYLFEKVELGEDEKTLFIYPKGKEIAEKIGKGNIDVYVTVDGNMIDAEDNYSVRHFYNSDIVVAKVRYVAIRETTPPVIDTIKLEDYDGSTCSEKVFENWKNLEAATNYCNNKVVIKTLDVFEAQTGIAKLKVKETLCYKPDGTIVDNAASYTKVYTKDDNIFVEKTDSSHGHYMLKVPFDYTFQTTEDGVIKLEISIEDEAENSSVIRTFYVIKDTKFNLKDCGAYFNRGEINSNNVFEGDFKIGAEVFAKNSKYTFQTKDNTSSYIYAYKIKYTYSTKEGRILDSSDYVNLTSSYKVKVNNIDAKASDIITITMKDAVGNEDSIDYQIPGMPVLLKKENIIRGGEKYKKFTVNKINDLDKADENIVYLGFRYSILSRNSESEDWEEGSINNCERSGYSTYGIFSSYIDTTNYDYVKNSSLGIGENEDEPINSSTKGYKIYVQVYALEKYSKINIEGSISSNIKGKLVCIYDSTAEPGTMTVPSIEWGISNSTKGAPNSGIFDVELKIKKANTDNLKFYAKMGSEYVELMTDSSDEEYNYSKIQIPFGTITEIELFAQNDENQICSLGTKGNPDWATFIFDTVAPEFSFGNAVLNTYGKEQYDHFTYSYNGEYIMAIAPTDNLEPSEDYLVEEEDKKGNFYNPIECYYLEGYKWNGRNIEEYSDEFKNIYSTFPHNVLKGRNVDSSSNNQYCLFNTGTSQYNYLVPIIDMEDDVSTPLYLILYDKADNYFAGVGAIGAIETLKNIPKVTYDQTNKNATVSISPDADKPYRNYSVTQFYWDTAESEWKGACATDYEFTYGASGFKLGPVDTATFMTLNSGNNKYEYIKNDVYTGLFGEVNTTDKFSKFTVRADHYKTSMDETIFDVPDDGYDIHTDLLSAFSYPVYYYTGEQDSEWTLGNMVEGNKGISILSDMPVYMHTITSNKNRGSNIDEWERRGEKIGQKYVDSKNFNYEFPLDEIEDGDYYVLVAYFANNTRVISSVYQK